MTSFDEPEAGLLVEHLLPSLLGGSYSLSQELQERTLFFGELGTALDVLHGRLTVISSPPRAAREDFAVPVALALREPLHRRRGVARRAARQALGLPLEGQRRGASRTPRLVHEPHGLGVQGPNASGLAGDVAAGRAC